MKNLVKRTKEVISQFLIAKLNYLNLTEDVNLSCSSRTGDLGIFWFNFSAKIEILLKLVNPKHKKIFEEVKKHTHIGAQKPQV